MNYQGCLLKFGAYTLDVDARTLSRGGWRLRLPRKAVEVLLVLMEKQGEVVSIQDLMDAVWGDAALQPGNLTHYISELRRVLCDDSGEYIRTMHRHGYKFVPPVSIAKAA